jgi:hypothetical protein
VFAGVFSECYRVCGGSGKFHFTWGCGGTSGTALTMTKSGKSTGRKGKCHWRVFRDGRIEHGTGLREQPLKGTGNGERTCFMETLVFTRSLLAIIYLMTIDHETFGNQVGISKTV